MYSNLTEWFSTQEPLPWEVPEIAHFGLPDDPFELSTKLDAGGQGTVFLSAAQHGPVQGTARCEVLTKTIVKSKLWERGGLSGQLPSIHKQEIIRRVECPRKAKGYFEVHTDEYPARVCCEGWSQLCFLILFLIKCMHTIAVLDSTSTEVLRFSI